MVLVCGVEMPSRCADDSSTVPFRNRSHLGNYSGIMSVESVGVALRSF
jgi:hypothetical protein